jgi:hypothetical protein
MSQLYTDLLQAFKEIAQIEKNKELAKEVDEAISRDKKKRKRKKKTARKKKESQTHVSHSLWDAYSDETPEESKELDEYYKNKYKDQLKDD